MSELRPVKVVGKMEEGALFVFTEGELHRAEIDTGPRVPMPDVSAFERSSGSIERNMLAAPQPLFEFDHAEYPESGGIFVYLKGLKYPTKGFPFPEAVHANDIAKRIIVATMSMMASNPLVMLPFITRRGFMRGLRRIGLLMKRVLLPFFLEPKRYQKSVNALGVFVDTFLESVDSKNTHRATVGKLFRTVLEYDNAYVLRIQDLANETTNEALRSNPIGELRRLMGILAKRERRPHLIKKFNSVVTALRFALFIPWFRRAFYEALNRFNVDDVKMDEADRYYVLRWAKYDFLGMTDEERHAEFARIHGGEEPKAMMVQSL